MEFFLPSLFAFLIAVLLIMFVVPRLSPILLGVLALVFLVLAAHQHFTFFATEYSQSTWHLSLLAYAPYIVLGALILFLIFYIYTFVGTGSTAVALEPIANINTAINNTVANIAPPAMLNGITNKAGNIVANAANGIKNTVTNLYNNVTNVLSPATPGQNRRNNPPRYPFSSV